MIQTEHRGAAAPGNPRILAFAALLSFAALAGAQTPAWVERSNKIAEEVLRDRGQFFPEGRRFDLRAFNDFIVAQGLLPPRVLEQAVMEEFVRERAAKTAAP